jgi:hypothetical protein
MDSSSERESDADIMTSEVESLLFKSEIRDLCGLESFSNETRLASFERRDKSGERKILLLASGEPPGLESYNTEVAMRLSIHESSRSNDIADVSETLVAAGDGEAGTSTAPFRGFVLGVENGR